MGSLLVACADGRLRNALDELTERLDAGDADRLLVPGGPLALAPSAAQREHMLEWIELLVRRHGVGTVYLVAHQHCMTYERLHGGFFFDERDTLIRELGEARRAILDRCYGVATASFLIPWQDDGTEGFGDGESVD